MEENTLPHIPNIPITIPDTKEKVESNENAYNIELKAIKMSVAVMLTSAITLVLGSSLFLTYAISMIYKKSNGFENIETLRKVMWSQYGLLWFLVFIFISISLYLLYNMRNRANELDDGSKRERNPLSNEE